MNPRFNLCHDPWVMVLDEHHSRHEISLIEAFQQAHRWRALAGELPSQQVAVLRLMLAIMYRALRHDDYPDEAQEEWGGWWQHGLPVDRVLAYLSEHESRFELFDDTEPFMQVADLHTARGTTSGLSKLIAELPDGFQYFTTRAGRGLDSIGPAEAARWLVHAHAFDPSGIKSGAVGDARVKAGKGYPIGIGWAGNLGLVVPEGCTLAETLLLNFVHEAPSPEEDEPPWERAPATAAEDQMLASRCGPAALLTWQSRRIRLFRNGDALVVDALVCQGDRIGAQNRHKVEWGSAWRRSANQEKSAGGGAVYMPVAHLPERAVWRGLAGMLTGVQSTSGASQSPERLPPEVVVWLGHVRQQGYLPGDHPIRYRAVGVEYINNSSVIASVTDDAMALHTAVLTDEVLKDVVVDAVKASESAVLALRNLAGDLAQARGGGTDGPRARAGEQAWHMLDSPFRRWASRLRADSDIQGALTEWHETARVHLSRLAYSLIGGAGDTAWKGREVRGPADKAVYVDSAVAELRFHRSLRRALDRAYPPAEATPLVVHGDPAPETPIDEPTEEPT